MIAILFFIGSLVVAFGSEGAFDKKKEDSYHQIIIGVVSDVRVVALIGSRPASVADVKKSSKKKEHSKRSLLYTRILKVEKTFKGKLSPGDEVIITWSQAGHAGDNGHMSIALACPRVSRSVAQGKRLVFGLTAVSGAYKAWHIVDGPTSLYEPKVIIPENSTAEKIPNKTQ